MPPYISSQNIPYLLVEAVQTTSAENSELQGTFPPAVFPHQRNLPGVSEQTMDSRDVESETYRCPVYVRPMNEAPNVRGQRMLQMDEVLNVQLACNREHAPSYWTLLSVSIVGT